MKTPAERIGAALAKAGKPTPAQMTSAIEGKKEGDAQGGEPAAAMYRTNLRDVPAVEGLSRDDGWVDMQVQFLIDKKTAGAYHGVGRTVLKPGARHENHRHRHCDEFFIVIKGRGAVYTATGESPSREGDVVYSARGGWSGCNNRSDEYVVPVWGWMGAGSIEASGYEIHPAHKRSL